MAVKQRTVEYVEEVDSLLSLVIQAVKDAKSGKGPVQTGADLLPSLISVLTGVTQLGEELKNAKVVEETVGYRVGDLVAAFTQ